MPDDVVGQLLSRPPSLASGEDAAPLHWQLLAKLESATIGRRGPNGTITVRRRDPAGCFLYGPYQHLPEGRYRLTFRCRCGPPRMASQPVLGVEVIVLSRFQQQWCDFTAAELALGVASLDFTVPYEHSLESENEGRFEFRFLHLGNADLEVTAVELESLPPHQASTAAPRRWRLLGRLQKSWLGRRAGNGRIRVGALEPAGCLLYGGWPYLRLPRGGYRLTLQAACAQPEFPDAPVLGIEVLAQSRWRNRHAAMLQARLPASNGMQLLWRDVTAAEIGAGPVTIDFAVPTEIALESGADAPFDIRLHHFGNAALDIAALDLVEIDDPVSPPLSTWHLLRRLRPGRVGTHEAGGVAVHRGDEAAPLLVDRRGVLLPQGRFRLQIKGEVQEAASPATPLLSVTITGRPAFADDPRLWRAPTAVATGSVSAAELAAGSGAIDFAVSPQQALGAGNWRFSIALHNCGGAGYALRGVDLCQLPDAPPQTDAIGAPRLRPAGRRKVVIIGNCQSETLRQGFMHSESLNRLFDVKYHFIQLPANLHEFAARDLETCDVLLIQDIQLWNEFPLQDRVRPGADVARFPLIRFSSLWPFDAWNGPGDREAHEREAPNLTFPYLDGLLGRLRLEIPDRDARFAAYRSLECPGVVNYRRLHDIEARRLGKMDKKFDFAIGAFILENARHRRVFHTTVRPNWEVFALLMQHVATQVGVTGPISLHAGIDRALRNPQVPVHPQVARDLGVTWADEHTRYLNRGREITWETYIRDYINHYG